jgi:hypothetical protein
VKYQPSGYGYLTAPVLSRVRAAGYDLALSRGQERGMDELEMFKITSKTPFSV